MNITGANREMLRKSTVLPHSLALVLSNQDYLTKKKGCASIKYCI
jgi:hypothetical protein